MGDPADCADGDVIAGSSPQDRPRPSLDGAGIHVGSRLGDTNTRRVTLTAVTALLVVGLLVVISERSAGGPPRLDGQVLTYRVPHERWLSDDGILFSRLSGSQLSRVKVSPREAALEALEGYDLSGRPHVVFESLGGYVDKSEIIRDWVGTKSWVPRAIPAYFLRIHGRTRAALDYRFGITSDCDVILSATAAQRFYETTCGGLYD